MATNLRSTHGEITFAEALELLSREERFMATVSAMNSLLVDKGIYTPDEFEAIFVEWAANQMQRPKTQRPGWR